MLRNLVFCGALLAAPATTLAVGSDAGQPAAAMWVRTVEGWESFDHVSAAPSDRSGPTLHPFVLAAWIGLGSAFVLVASDWLPSNQA